MNRPAIGTRLPPSSTFDDLADFPERTQDSGAPLATNQGTRTSAGLIPGALALAVSFLLVVPLTGKGWLLLLDWVLGPHVALPRSFWGLDNSLQSGLPLSLVVVGLSHLVGATAGWFVIAMAVATAGIAVGRLVGGPTVTRVAAGTLYAVNPLVFDRTFAGHIGYLLAYAMLPLAVASLLRWRDDISWRGMRPSLWLAVLTACTPHFFWIGGIVILAHVIIRRGRVRSLGWASLIAGLALLMSAYFAVPSIGRPAPVTVGEADLASYRTRPDPTLGLAVNVAGLYGFWRPEPKLPKDDVGGWPVFLGAIVLLAGFGLVGAWRKEKTRHLAAVLALSGGAGFFLALGDQGPTGPVFRFLFDHLPGFAIMREPQKFVALLALAYAAGFGFALDDLARRVQSGRGRLAVGALAVGLPILYTPTLFFGLAGRVETSRYPASWAAADRLMGVGEGKVLFLPWHQYLGFPFTGRVIANPADVAFRRDAIEGDNVELANLSTSSTLTRSSYLEFLYAHGQELCAFGRLVAPLGVQYVALASAADSDRYNWLGGQVDLQRVLDRPGMVLYRNLAYTAGGTRGRSLERAADWGELATLANAGALAAKPYVVDSQGPGSVADQPCRASASPPVPAPRARHVTPESPVAYRVSRGTEGYVGLPEPYDRSWRLNDQPAIELAGGTVGLRTNGSAATAHFGHWSRVRLGYLISGTTAATVLVAGLRGRRSRDKDKRRIDTRRDSDEDHPTAPTSGQP